MKEIIKFYLLCTTISLICTLYMSKYGLCHVAMTPEQVTLYIRLAFVPIMNTGMCVVQLVIITLVVIHFFTGMFL